MGKAPRSIQIFRRSNGECGGRKQASCRLVEPAASACDNDDFPFNTLAHVGLHTCGFQRGKHTIIPEGNPSDANARGVVDRVPDCRKHRFEGGLTGSVGRQIGTVRIRIAVHQDDINALGNIGVAESRGREPVLAGHLLRIESDFFVKSAAEAMKRTAFNGVPQAFRIHRQTAIVRAHQTLRPNMTRLAIHFDVGDLRNNRMAPERVCYTAAGEDLAFTSRVRRGPRIPAIRFRSGFENRD